MPSQIGNEKARNNLFTSSDYKDRPITMSITQSNSFESTHLPNMDTRDLAISLSASSESLDFHDDIVGVDLNLKGSFSEEKQKRAGFNEKCEVSVVSSRGAHDNACEVSVASSKTEEKRGNYSSQGRSTNAMGYGPHAHACGPPPPHGYHMQVQHYSSVPVQAPHFHPHYQRSYYPTAGNNPHHYSGGRPQQFDHRYPPNGPQGGSYHPAMHYQNSQQSFHPHNNPPHGYPRHGLPPPPSSMNSSLSNPRQYPPNPNSNNCAMSVSSHGSSKKRTLEGMLEEDTGTSTFSKHRSSSNSSTCSTATAGNNTSAETINQMICESPLKKERTENSRNNGRREFGGSSSAISFVGLSMGTQDKVKPIKLMPKLEIGVTPVSKNTTRDKKKRNETNFSFDEDETQEKRYFPEEHSLKKQLRDQSFTPIHPTELKRNPSSSPYDQLENVPQLSWGSIDEDDSEVLGLSDWTKAAERNASPMSFNGNISPMLFKEDDMMRMGVLSPTDGNGHGERSPPLSFPKVPHMHDYPKAHERRARSPQRMGKQQFQKSSYEMQTQFPGLSPNGSMPMAPKQPFQNPPTPQGPSLSHSINKYERRSDTFHRNIHSSNRDGPPTPNYQSPRGFPGQVYGQDRIRNLRGRVSGALPPPMNLPPHLPSHAHFLTSPIGTNPRGVIMSSPHQQRISSHHYPHSPHLSASKRKCVSLKAPIPSKFQGDMEKYKNATVPEFTSLVNFPAHMSQKQASAIPDGMRCCVMCGHACQCSASTKNRKGAKKSIDADTRSNIGGSYAIIPTQNKGLCTQCDVNVWVVTKNNLEIKWCKGCKNFRPWAAFGEKGLATKCMRCRERQREKYAAQKEEKDKKKKAALSKAKPLLND